MIKKTLIAALLGVAAADLVSHIQDVPSCAFHCYWAVTAHLKCGVSEFACACKDQEKLLGLLEPCTKLYCSESDNVLALSLTTDVCSDVDSNPSFEQYSSASGAITAAVGRTGNDTVAFSYAVTSGSPTTIAATTLTYGDRTTSISEFVVNQAAETDTAATTTSESSGSTGLTESTEATGSTSPSSTETDKAVDATETTGNRKENDGASLYPGIGVIGGAVLAVLAF
ncbi:hypothetical protein GGR57DRAFT_502421 [Xylariaceae sp. FL1272]|nr:hypothetical protein GGR57DRAFT_502421 [Xylariaceae sp. FL1272]